LLWHQLVLRWNFINSGRLYVTDDRSLGAPGSPIVFNGGQLGIDRPTTINRDITLNANAAIDCGVATIAGNIHGTGSLTTYGAGSYLKLTGHNSYSGGTFVNQLTLSGTTDSIQGNVSLANVYAQLQFQQDFNGVYSGNISGGGELLKSGAGTLTLTGNNTFTSDTQL
jgi:fibronectin-binding autotransporter adhesin